MSVLALLLGNRRLRREIEAQALQLGHDIAQEQLARSQLQQTLVHRVTSPLGLLSAAAAGFVAGRIGSGRSSNESHALANTSRTLSNTVTGTVATATALVIAAARSIGIQVLLPMVIEWVQSKFESRENNEGGADLEEQAESKLPSQK
jgi:hypothetical protein